MAVFGCPLAICEIVLFRLGKFPKFFSYSAKLLFGVFLRFLIYAKQVIARFKIYKSLFERFAKFMAELPYLSLIFKIALPSASSAFIECGFVSKSSAWAGVSAGVSWDRLMPSIRTGLLPQFALNSSIELFIKSL